MRGVITGIDVVMNCRLIWREFGLRCLLRCLVASLEMGRKTTTFLDVAFRK
ncbi:MAG: hypothetical protein K1X64_13335 [Myxococcaceae bacterium]|nr:hypothetical protein [Myxococcaceae bacterium]